MTKETNVGLGWVRTQFTEIFEQHNEEPGKTMAKQKDPEVGEYWWAWPPNGGDAEPVEILTVQETGNHALGIIGRSDFGYARQWSLVRRIEGRPKPS